MKTRMLYTKVWQDSYFASLIPIESYLFLYFLLNDYVTVLHLYECPDRTILHETRVTTGELAVAKDKFQKADKIYFYKDWIYLKNADRYEQYAGLANKGKDNLVRQLNDDIYTWYVKVKGSPLEAPLKGTREQDKDKEQEIDQDKGYRDFLKSKEKLTNKLTYGKQN